MRIEHLHRRLISLLAMRLLQRPDIGFLVLTPTNDISAIVAEACPDLTAVILVSSEFQLKTLVTPIVKSYSRVIARDQHFGIAGGCIESRDTSDLAAFCILATSRSDMYLSLVP